MTTPQNPTHIHCAEMIMSFPVVGIDYNGSLFEAKNIMFEYQIETILVFGNDTHHCIGYIDYSTVEKATNYGLGKHSVTEYMQEDVITATYDASLQEIASILVNTQQPLVPILKENVVIGIVTLKDMLHSDLPETVSDILLKKNSPPCVEVLLNESLSTDMYSLLLEIGMLGDFLETNVYVVGGFVRDMFFHSALQENIDIDLVIEGNVIMFANALAEKLQGSVCIYNEFMTAVVLYPDDSGKELRIDITTARLEYYMSPGVLPIVETSSITKDLYRRDITINAMAIQLNQKHFGRLLDFFDGQKDIQYKRIQPIHTLSFIEDPTRIFRAIRFEQRHHFTITQHTEQLINNALRLDMIKKIFGARLMHEFELIFKEHLPQNCIVRMDELGVLAAIDKNFVLTQKKKDLLFMIQDVLTWYQQCSFEEKQPNVVVLYFLGLCSTLTWEVSEDILNHICVPQHLLQTVLTTNEEVQKALEKLIVLFNNINSNAEPSISSLYIVVSLLSLEGLLYLMSCAPNKRIYDMLSQYIRSWRFVTPDITGHDLKKLGLVPGPQYKHILQDIHKEKLDGKLQTKQEQLSYIRSTYII